MNIVDIDEEPLVNMNILRSTLSEDINTDTKFAEIEVIDPEQNGIAISISGDDKDKVIVSNSGSIILNDGLDYEKKKELNFIIDVFDGKNTVSTPINIKVENVNDLSASVNLSNNKVHEGISTNTTIGEIDVIGDSELSYSISGDNSDDFIISEDGKIKVVNPLDYSTKNSYDLTLNINGQNDTVKVPLVINIAQNQDPDFVNDCENSCFLDETALAGAVISNVSRTDSDVDALNYSLDNNYENKFSIDSNTGEVKAQWPS